MRRICAGAIALILTFAPLAFGQGKSAAAPEAGEDWKALDHKWLDSERTGDLDYLGKFFADSYVLVLANGQSYTKKEWLGILRGPDRPTLLLLNPENIKVHVFGNVAILTDHTTIKGHDSKGEQPGWRIQRFSRGHQTEWKLARHRRGDEPGYDKEVERGIVAPASRRRSCARG